MKDFGKHGRIVRLINRAFTWIDTRLSDDEKARLIERIIVAMIVPLVGRGVQIQRQDNLSACRREDGNEDPLWLHHAPFCPANHYHHTRPITGACTCGAESWWRNQVKTNPSWILSETV